MSACDSALPPADSTDAADARLVALVAASQPSLRAYLHSLVRQSADVDDCLQETNVVLWRKRSEYDPARPFLAWACAIARLQALAHCKRVARRDHVPFDDELFARVAAAAAQHVENQEERLRALRQCLEALPPRYRQLVDQRYAAGKPVREMAHALELSAEAVSMALYRARKQLLECIQLRLARESQP